MSATRSLGEMPDESLAVALGFLAEGSLAQVASTCISIRAVAQADRLWLPLASRRWHFGGAQLPPGARASAAASALALALEEPLHAGSAGAASAFAERCARDSDVVLLALQYDAVRTGHAKETAGQLQPGTVVRISGLTVAQQYNGLLGVVRAAGADEAYSGEAVRHPVALPSLVCLKIKSIGLTVVRPPQNGFVQQQVAELGGEAVDCLLRLASSGPLGAAWPSLTVAAGQLLGLALEQWALKQWGFLLADEGRAEHLEEGALIVSMWADARVDVTAVRAQLASLASEATRRTSADRPLRERIDAVNAILFDEYGLSGNVHNYYEAENSLLHSVLERRRGIPISLSIIWAAVARRVEIPCFLCSAMPAHVVIRVRASVGNGREDLFVDAFNRKVMDRSGLETFAESLNVPHFQEEFVGEQPVTMVYLRVLRNLLGIYQQAAQVGTTFASMQAAAAVCSQLLAIADASPGGMGANAAVEQRRAYFRSQLPLLASR